jgi:hypothetical protein
LGSTCVALSSMRGWLEFGASMWIAFFLCMARTQKNPYERGVIPRAVRNDITLVLFASFIPHTS